MIAQRIAVRSPDRVQSISPSAARRRKSARRSFGRTGSALSRRAASSPSPTPFSNAGSRQRSMSLERTSLPGGATCWSAPRCMVMPAPVRRSVMRI
jgi:hypothetical protein